MVYALLAHIADRNREIQPFRGREGVSAAVVPVLFTPVFTPGCYMDRRDVVDNESCRTETDEGENREKAENPVGEDIYTTERLGVVTKLGEEPIGNSRRILFWWLLLLLEGILGEACPYFSGEFPSRDVVNGDGKERYYCEERG